MAQIKEDEEYFELINDFPSSDLAIVHDLTLAIMKIRGVYHPDYRGYRDERYLENCKNIVPFEDKITIFEYYMGGIGFDEDYVKEHLESNNIKLIK